MRKLMPVPVLLLLVACAHESPFSPTPQPPATQAPPATISVEPVFLSAPPTTIPAAVNCSPEDYHFLGWRFDVARDQGRGPVVTATPTFGRRGLGTWDAIPGECRALWVGPEGPRWHGSVAGAPDPADPYRYLGNIGANGQLWACTRTTGECVDFTL